MRVRARQRPDIACFSVGHSLPVNRSVDALENRFLTRFPQSLVYLVYERVASFVEGPRGHSPAQVTCQIGLECDLEIHWNLEVITPRGPQKLHQSRTYALGGSVHHDLLHWI